MMKEPLNASSAFLVRGPVVKGESQCQFPGKCSQYRQVSGRRRVILTIVGFLRGASRIREGDDCVPRVGVAYVTTVQFPYVVKDLVTSFLYSELTDRSVPHPHVALTHRLIDGPPKTPTVGRRRSRLFSTFGGRRFR